MRGVIVCLGLCLWALAGVADDDVAAPPARARPAGPPGIVAAPSTAEPGASNAAGAAPPASFTSEAKWELAGYNNDEVIYTILVTSHDSRIIRCTTELSGSYFENGKKQSVSDRQLSTVFPDQQVQVGNWMGMDQQSGATYSVRCRAV